jgi:hypothetical protein
MTAAANLVGVQFPAMIRSGREFQGRLNIVMTLFVVVNVLALLLMAVARWVAVIGGLIPPRREKPASV